MLVRVSRFGAINMPFARPARPLILAMVLVLGAGVPVAAYAAQTHLVERGQTLSHIAALYGVTIGQLTADNALADPNLIYAGQVLRITAGTPPAGAIAVFHEVAPGENLTQISKKYGVPLATLVELNRLDNPSLILIGQKLQVGAGSTSGGSTTVSPGVAQHVVAPGETLSMIAAKYNTLVTTLVEVNGLQSANLIVVGQTLTVPSPHAPGPGEYVSSAQARSYLTAAADEFGISRSLILALSWQETGWQNDLVSSAGAIGLMQLLPITGEWAEEWLLNDAPAWRTSARDNARLGTAFFRHLLDRYGWNVDTALAAYYQGGLSVETYGMFEETRVYVANVKALMNRF